MSLLTNRMMILIEANANKAIAEFKQTGAAAKGLAKDTGVATGSVAGLGGKLGGLGKYAAGAALAGAGTGLVAFATKGVEAFTTLAGEVRKFQQIAGGTSEDASRLLDVFGDLGIDAQAAGGGIFQMTKRIAANGQVLAKHGVQVARDAAGNVKVKDTLLAVGDAYKATADPAARAALLAAAFGKQGTALIPILSRSREEIEKMFAGTTSGEIITAEEQQKAEEYRLAMVDLGDAFKSLQMEAGKALVPFLTDVAKAISGALDLRDKVAQALNVGPETTAGGIGGLGAWIDSLIDGETVTNEVTEATNDFKGALLGGAIAAIQNQNAAVEDDAEALKDLDSALMSAASAERALGAANRSLSDAQSDYNKLVKEGAVDEEKVVDARQSLAEATRSLGKANRELANSQEEYDEALATFNILGTDTAADALADAGDNLADAKDGVASASERERDAREELAKAQAGDPEFQDKLAAAKQKVADATFDVSEKSLANAKAQDIEAAAVKANADQVERLLGYYNEMIAKSPAAWAALSPVVDTLMSGPGAPHVFEVPAASGGGTGGTTAGTTNNVTVNMTHPIDPQTLARTIVWNMGPPGGAQVS